LAKTQKYLSNIIMKRMEQESEGDFSQNYEIEVLNLIPALSLKEKEFEIKEVKFEVKLKKNLRQDSSASKALRQVELSSQRFRYWVSRLANGDMQCLMFVHTKVQQKAVDESLRLRHYASLQSRDFEEPAALNFQGLARDGSDSNFSYAPPETSKGTNDSIQMPAVIMMADLIRGGKPKAAQNEDVSS
jgi:hypothetical protein